MSPEHRAKTFLDGAVAEGPVIPHPLRPESPPKLMEMIQFLPVAPPAHFPIFREDVAERLVFELATSLYSAAKLASIARIAKRSKRRQPTVYTVLRERQKRTIIEVASRPVPDRPGTLRNHPERHPERNRGWVRFSGGHLLLCRCNSLIARSLITRRIFIIWLPAARLIPTRLTILGSLDGIRCSSLHLTCRWLVDPTIVRLEWSAAGPLFGYIGAKVDTTFVHFLGFCTSGHWCITTRRAAVLGLNRPAPELICFPQLIARGS